MERILETGRMVLRRITEEDRDELFALHNDPDVMRYLNGGRPVPAERVDHELQRMLGWYERGPFGYWPAIEKATGRFLGWFLLRPRELDEPGTVELGYRLHKAAWGRGYATEGSLALIRKGFTELGVRRVYAHTMTVNKGSRRVMEKAGLRYVRTFDGDLDEPIAGSEHGEVEYALDLDEWRRGTGEHTTG
ncbi:GNAT family N-acetyltransferase [Saccharopolyspora erythraea]|uniref:GNAT family N-acetyltransferase n=1 Tax=Saccharopolyspora erythraea TaxID=1836 RepID=UPI001BAACFCA|nr:GNAT family N-acetyltransferase [Saccharopolyspora erythraea]QUH04280.1 GNAT family N-acetyltransferase [Saccharopolyspora erythraea]